MLVTAPVTASLTLRCQRRQFQNTMHTYNIHAYLTLHDKEVEVVITTDLPMDIRRAHNILRALVPNEPNVEGLSLTKIV